MSPQPEDDPTSPDSTRPGGLATVLRSLTNSKAIKAPPPPSNPSAALPRAELINAIPTNSHGLSTNHMDAFEQLKNGSPSERISAANTLKYAITEYPLNPILDIWYAAKDLIDPNNPTLDESCWLGVIDGMRETCIFDRFGAERPASPEKNSHSGRGAGGSSRGKTAALGEDKNFAQLFLFLLDVIKFSFNTADEPAVTDLIDTILTICMNTSQEDDLRSCINVLDAIVTFGSIPQSKLKDCVQVLSSIYCLVPNLQKNSWHTIANLCKSHNGQATVRIMLDILRNLQPGVNEKDSSREIRGSLAVLQKLLSKTTEKGYPPVPYALLVDGLSNTLKATKSLRVYAAACN
ncbi:Tuberous sclerosis 2-like protein [Metarhizium acridum]|nr:Tuberous sclerosis 2-like protein [Metarhizium acridum]